MVPVHTRCTEWSGFLGGILCMVHFFFVIAKRVFIRSRATSNRLPVRAYGKSCRLVRRVLLQSRGTCRSVIPYPCCRSSSTAATQRSGQVCAYALAMAVLASDLSGNEGNNKQNADAVNRHRD